MPSYYIPPNRTVDQNGKRVVGCAKGIITVWCSEDRPESDKPTIQEGVYSCVNAQQEICPTTNKRHWHIYFEVANGKRKSWKQLLADFYPSKSKKDDLSRWWNIQNVVTNNGASEYPLKDETSVPGTRIQYGKAASKGTTVSVQGDLRGVSDNCKDAWEGAKEAIMKCKSINEVIGCHPHAMKYTTWATQYFNTKLIDLEHDIVQFRPWQKKVDEIFENSNAKRQIVWVIDFEGNTGKSEYTKWKANQLGEDLHICTGGKFNDITYAYKGEPYVIIDLARSCDPIKYPYGFMEVLKNGVMTKGKYISQSCRSKPAKVLVFSNERYMEEKLSKDRLCDTTIYLNNKADTCYTVLPEAMDDTLVDPPEPSDFVKEKMARLNPSNDGQDKPVEDIYYNEPGGSSSSTGTRNRVQQVVDNYTNINDACENAEQEQYEQDEWDELFYDLG